MKLNVLGIWTIFKAAKAAGGIIFVRSWRAEDDAYITPLIPHGDMDNMTLIRGQDLLDMTDKGVKFSFCFRVLVIVNPLEPQEKSDCWS